MDQFFSKISEFTDNAVSKIRLASALNSTLWLCGVALMFGLVGVWAFEGPMEYVFAFFPTVAIATFVFQTIYFTIYDPSKLRSEEYELRRHALSIIEEKGGNIAISESSVEAIAGSDYRPDRLPKLPGQMS
jgi:membrane protein implicated in regulation of membrane protease activity